MRSRPRPKAAIAAAIAVLIISVSILPLLSSTADAESVFKPVDWKKGDKFALVGERPFYISIETPDSLLRYNNRYGVVEDIIIEHAYINSFIGGYLLADVRDFDGEVYTLDLSLALNMTLMFDFQLNADAVDPGNYYAGNGTAPAGTTRIADAQWTPDQEIRVYGELAAGTIIKGTAIMTRSNMSLRSLTASLESYVTGVMSFKNVPGMSLTTEQAVGPDGMVEISYINADIDIDAHIKMDGKLRTVPEVTFADWTSGGSTLYSPGFIYADYNISGSIDLQGLPQSTEDAIFSSPVMGMLGLESFPIDLSKLEMGEILPGDGRLVFDGWPVDSLVPVDDRGWTNYSSPASGNRPVKVATFILGGVVEMKWDTIVGIPIWINYNQGLLSGLDFLSPVFGQDIDGIIDRLFPYIGQDLRTIIRLDLTLVWAEPSFAEANIAKIEAQTRDRLTYDAIVHEVKKETPIWAYALALAVVAVAAVIAVVTIRSRKKASKTKSGSKGRSKLRWARKPKK